ncbi:MAG: radical SAM protein [Candidatus Korobacteraceae bacterium]
MAFEGFPFIVGWELTLACNLRCRHCASTAGLPRKNELSLEECLALCDQFPALLVQEVDFTGGEPLLKTGWEQIAVRLRELGIATRIITNGIELSEETVRRMREAGLAGVGVSLDGIEATHDYVRARDGMFGLVIAGLERLVAAGLPPTVITAVNSRSLCELPQVFDLLRSLGVRSWQLQPIFPSGRSFERPELQLSEEQYLELGRFVAEWEPKGRELGLELRAADSCGYFTELATGPEWHGCNAGIVAAGIMSDGRVKGCLSMPDELADGDLRKSDLWDIWFRPGAFAYTRDYERSKLGPNCAGCEYGDQCRGGCTSMSYTTMGRIHDDPYCFHGMRARHVAGIKTQVRHAQLVPLGGEADASKATSSAHA